MIGKGIAVSIAMGLALFAGVVFYAVHRPPNPEGFSGLTVAPLTPAAAARTPLLGHVAARLIQQVDGGQPCRQGENRSPA